MTMQFDLLQALRNLAIEVKPFGHGKQDGMDPTDCRGYSHDRWLAINPDERWPAFVTFHEMTHILLGHTTLDKKWGVDLMKEWQRVKAGHLPSEKACEFMDYREQHHDLYEAECHLTAIIAAELTGTPFSMEDEILHLMCCYTKGRDIPGYVKRRARKTAKKIALAGKVDQRSRRGTLVAA